MKVLQLAGFRVKGLSVYFNPNLDKVNWLEQKYKNTFEVVLKAQFI